MPIAHAGHYATSGLLFVLGPLLLFAVMLAVAWVRSRRPEKPTPGRPPSRRPTRTGTEPAKRRARGPRTPDGP